MSDQPEPWEKQPTESGKAFAAFQVYRDTPVRQRSLRKLADTLGYGESQIKEWSAQHRWRERVEAWDMEQDRVLRDQQTEDRKNMMRRLSAAGALLQARSLTGIRNFIDRVDHDGQENELRPGQKFLDTLQVGDLLRMLEVGARLEILGRGGPVIEQEDSISLTIVENPIMAAIQMNPGNMAEAMRATRELLATLNINTPRQVTPIELPAPEDE